VPPPLDVRRKAFAAFVRRALRNAKDDRGWSIPKVAEVARIGNPTIYRWRDGEWAKAPSPDAVVAFCDALDIDPKHAFAILWPGKNDDAPPPEPGPLDRDVELLARRLRDPNVSEAEKVSIRATIRYLVGRATAPAGE
jgi:transcriptional regulator with XRE-family HTH domain